MVIKKKTIPILLLIALGYFQVIGYVFELPKVRGLGSAYMVAPLPLVFSHFRGLETYASKFKVELEFIGDKTVTLPIDSIMYGKVMGPYNRRNIYGAALAYGPKFTSPKEKELLNAILSYGFCKPAVILMEFGFIETPLRGKILVSGNHKVEGSHFLLEKKNYELSFTCQS